MLWGSIKIALSCSLRNSTTSFSVLYNCYKRLQRFTNTTWLIHYVRTFLLKYCQQTLLYHESTTNQTAIARACTWPPWSHLAVMEIATISAKLFVTEYCYHCTWNNLGVQLSSGTPFLLSPSCYSKVYCGTQNHSTWGAAPNSGHKFCCHSSSPQIASKIQPVLT